MIQELPRILVIDDQFGRCGLGADFQRFVAPDIMDAYRMDRANLCSNYGILDLSGDSVPIPRESAQCAADFCPAQTWDNDNKRINNNLPLAIEEVEKGWPFPDGSRWTLVLLDLAFVQGELDIFGDPQERTFFGRDVILNELKLKFGNDLPIVILSSTPKEEQNETVRRAGALDFIQRVPNSPAEEGSSRVALSEMFYLHGLLPDSTGRVIGKSLTVLKMLRQARRAARYARTILLHGEIGSGKNLLARYIHEISPRAEAPFEVFNAAHRSAELQADELFGHWKGAFTGAAEDAPGIWERCDGGTVLIDEVEDIDISVQKKLMEPIEEGQVARMGSTQGMKKITIDVLTILATNRDLAGLSDSGVIKKDFLSRINATVIDIPPLRSRKEDIPDLIAKLTSELKSQVKLLPEALQVLSQYDWKDDNIRGLRRTLEQLAVSHPGQIVTPQDIKDIIDRVKDRGVGETPSENPLIDEQAELFLSFFKALSKKPDLSTREECRKLHDDYYGVFPGVLAYILSWSIQLCGDVTNTARFLTGNEDMDASAAQQFLKKYLKLDTKQKHILKQFMKYPEAQLPVLKKIIEKLYG